MGLFEGSSRALKKPAEELYQQEAKGNLKAKPSPSEMSLDEFSAAFKAGEMRFSCTFSPTSTASSAPSRPSPAGHLGLTPKGAETRAGGQNLAEQLGISPVTALDIIDSGGNSHSYGAYGSKGEGIWDWGSWGS